MTQVEINESLNPVRGQVINISRMLPTGAQYFTVDAKDVDKTFKERKEQILSNPKSPELILNRSPRMILVTGHSIVSQRFSNDAEGNSVVIFNEGLGDEAQAAIVAGGTNFGQTTDDAMRDAIHGELRIFADIKKTATKANQLNQNELDRLAALKTSIERQMDSLRSVIAANRKKMDDYAAVLNSVKPEVDITSGGGSVTVQIEDE